MNEKYEPFFRKIKLILDTIKNEFDLIISGFDNDGTIEKVFSHIKLNDSDSKFLNQIKPNLSSFMKDIILDIDEAKVTLRPCSDDLPNNEIRTINKSLDAFYAIRYVRHNIIMSFIMQIYLTFEKELISFVNLDLHSSVNSLFGAIKILEKSENFKFDEDFKETIDKYRNVCNVYKHGDGPSLEYLIKKYPNLINDFSIGSNEVDGSFIFNLNEISVNELYNLIVGYFCKLHIKN